MSYHDEPEPTSYVFASAEPPTRPDLPSTIPPRAPCPNCNAASLCPACGRLSRFSEALTTAVKLKKQSPDLSTGCPHWVKAPGVSCVLCRKDQIRKSAVG